MLLYFAFYSVVGQTGVRAVKNGATTELFFNKPIGSTTYDEVIGNPYLYEHFVQAEINGLKKTYFVRFNLDNNNIEFKDKDGVTMILNKSFDYSIHLLDGSNKEFETHSYVDDKGTTVKTFFEKAHVNKKYGLYIKAHVVYTPVKIAKNSFEQNKPGKFTKVKGSFYYKDLTKENTTLIEIPKREKLFLKQFGEQSNKLKMFTKKEKLKVDNKTDLVRILNYYFNLL